MKKIELEELKRIQLQMLSDIHNYCVSTNTTYFLAFGTLIGAIRHKGYIPWDDDIDIFMPRPVYEKFIQDFNGYYEHLDLYAPQLDWGYYAPYANVVDNRTIMDEGEGNSHRGRVMGIKIDVFPLDGVPDDHNQYLRHRKKLKFLNDILWSKRKSWSSIIRGEVKSIVKYGGLKIISCFFSYEIIQKRIHKTATKYSFENSKYSDEVVYHYMNMDSRCLQSDFSTGVMVEFEGMKFYAPVGYDDYLKADYGEYMKLPPKEKQVNHHHFNACWK